MSNGPRKAARRNTRLALKTSTGRGSFTPPMIVAYNAQMGLLCAETNLFFHKAEMVYVNRIADAAPLSKKIIRAMLKYFDANQKKRDEQDPDLHSAEFFWAEWLCAGGDEGAHWAKSIRHLVA